MKSNILNKFKEWLILNNHSTSAYIFIARKFLEKVLIEEITQEKVNAYFLELHNKYKPSYINSIRSGLQAFFLFLEKEKDIKFPQRAKEPVLLPKSITIEYFEKEVIPAVDCAYFENSLKVRALLYFMFYTGVRKSEVYLLKREDIDLIKKQVKVYLKKTKKEKIMLFPKKVKEALESYFAIEEEKQNAFNLGNFGIDYIFLKLKPFFKDITFHPHLFKKSAITHLHKCGFSETEISEMVGITKNTLSRYLDVNMDKIKETYDRRIK